MWKNTLHVFTAGGVHVKLVVVQRDTLHMHPYFLLYKEIPISFTSILQVAERHRWICNPYTAVFWCYSNLFINIEKS